MKKKVRVGTRNIPLTIAQTNIVVGIAPGYQFELILMGTLGDRDKQTPLSELGPQGVFADELSSAILAKELDFAVHSLKDLPIKQTEGLTVVYPKRENPFDSLIIREGKTLEQLPVAALIGTSSFRREVELLQRRPDLRPAPIRENIDQRLEQLNQGGFAGIILANAGLNRLGWQNPRHFSVINFDQHTFIPSAGQGTLALECRQSDHTTQTLLRNIADGDTMTCMAVERSFLVAYLMKKRWC